MSLFIVFNSLDIGGIERKIVDICQRYGPTSTSVYLLLKNPSGKFINQVPENITILSPPTSSRLTNLLHWYWINSQVKKYKPKAILTFGNFYSIHTLLAKQIFHFSTPVIVSEDSSIDVQINSDTFPRIRKLLVKFTYPAAASIITLTEIGKSKLIRLIPSLSDKVAVLPNWLPLSSKPSKPSPKTIDLLFLGRLVPQKDPFRFISLCRHFPKLRIVMVGSGILKPEIKKYIKKHNLNISLKPATTHPESYFRKSKILLLTSAHEGFPLTILEAIFNNCLVVCSNLSEVTSYFKYQKKLIINSTDQEFITNTQFLLQSTATTRLILNHYRSQIVTDQKKHFQNTINHLNHYL